MAKLLKKDVQMATLAAKAVLPEILTIEFDREDDGRWIAEVRELPGVMVYGADREDAQRKVKALALRVLADLVEEEERDTSNSFRFKVA